MNFDFADIKPSLLNWALIGLMAMSFIVVAKYTVNAVDNPVTVWLRPTVNAV